MRKIDKSKILSKNFREFERILEVDEHPLHESKEKREYYTDIKMNLLYAQKGLCAYSEKSLISDMSFISLDKWIDEIYTKELTDNEKKFIRGDIEHFNESLKPKNAFLWSNLFVVDTHINCRIKGKKPIIKDILKPDEKEYNPYEYLEFDLETGLFFPYYDLSPEIEKDVQYMIDILGLNCYHGERKEYLELILDLYPKREPKQFITAWNMTLNLLKEEQKK
jgi:hypothetical protein